VLNPKILMYMLLLAGAVLLIVFVSAVMKAQLRKSKYKTNKQDTNYINSILVFLSKYRSTERLVKFMADRISMFNPYSLEQNKEYAVMFLTILFFVMLLFAAIVLPSVTFVWYLLLFWIVLLVMFLFLVIVVFTNIASNNFTKKLPQAFRVVTSRFIQHKRIDVALKLSVDDVDVTVKREFTRIIDTLKTNDREYIEETFSMIERVYKDKYLTMLIILIKQAHFKGGCEEIIELFQDTNKKIQDGIERKKDLISASRTYILLLLPMPFSLLVMKKVNAKLLGEEVADLYYNTPQGVRMFIIIIMLSLFFCGVLVFKQRSSV
jgi:Flp pilus assembly protein TadB